MQVDIPTPRHIGVRSLRDNMRTLIERLAEGEHYLVLRHNRPVAALIPYEDLLRLTEAARRLAAAEALLRTRGYDPAGLSTPDLVRLASADAVGGGR